MLVEREATHRAIALAELVDVPILIVHVSGREAVEQIRWARAHGLKVFAETCPQYLFLTADDLGIDDSYHGARCVCSPPPRDKANQEVIWDGLADGLFTVFSLRPCAVPLRRPEGKKPGGEEVAFRHIPNGIPGIETRHAAALFRRRARRAHHAQPVRRAHRHQPGQGLRPASAQGHDRDRLAMPTS